MISSLEDLMLLNKLEDLDLKNNNIIFDIVIFVVNNMLIDKDFLYMYNKNIKDNIQKEPNERKVDRVKLKRRIKKHVKRDKNYQFQQHCHQHCHQAYHQAGHQVGHQVNHQRRIPRSSLPK